MKPRVLVTKGAGPIDAYVAALAEAGATPIQHASGTDLPPFDALCLSGGPDVEPWRFAAEPNGAEKPDPERDAVEIDHLLPLAWESGRPILAICRGLQVLNVFRRGTLVQDIGEAHRAKGSDVKPHPVRVEAASVLAGITGTALVVNSRHHQVIDRLGDGLRATAWTDGFIEAVEAPGRPWVVGVQWHPERPGECDPAATRIFDAFVRAAERVPAR